MRADELVTVEVLDRILAEKLAGLAQLAEAVNHGAVFDLPGAAGYLKLGQRTVQRYTANGQLQSVLVGKSRRWRKQDLDQFMEEHLE